MTKSTPIDIKIHKNKLICIFNQPTTSFISITIRNFNVPMTESKFDSVNSIEPVKILGKFNKIFFLFVNKMNVFFFLICLKRRKTKLTKRMENLFMWQIYWLENRWQCLILIYIWSEHVRLDVGLLKKKWFRFQNRQIFVNEICLRYFSFEYVNSIER